jgi:hypothetical protein
MSHLSGIEGSAPCGPGFPQVTGERQGRRDAFLQPARTNADAMPWPAETYASNPSPARVMGLLGGRGSPIRLWSCGLDRLADAGLAACAADGHRHQRADQRQGGGQEADQRDGRVRLGSPCEICTGPCKELRGVEDRGRHVRNARSVAVNGRIGGHDPPQFPSGFLSRYGQRMLPVCCPAQALLCGTRVSQIRGSRHWAKRMRPLRSRTLVPERSPVPSPMPPSTTG